VAPPVEPTPESTGSGTGDRQPATGGGTRPAGQPAKPPAVPPASMPVVRITINPDFSNPGEKMTLVFDGPPGVHVVIAAHVKWYDDNTFIGTSDSTFDGSGHHEASVNQRYPATACGNRRVELTYSTQSKISLDAQMIGWPGQSTCLSAPAVANTYTPPPMYP
jgi:hypothetical protein